MGSSLLASRHLWGASRNRLRRGPARPGGGLPVPPLVYVEAIDSLEVDDDRREAIYGGNLEAII